MDKKRLQLIAMILLGAGLLISGGMLFFILPKPAPASNPEEIPSVIPIKVDFPAPDLSLDDLQGRTASLADYRSQVVLLNNWATWCPPCKAEMPALEAYYRDHKDRGFILIGIEAGESAAEVSQFIQDYHLTFPVWLDPENRSLDAFKNDALPSSYVIARDGRVQLTWSGPISREMLDKYVTPLLEE